MSDHLHKLLRFLGCVLLSAAVVFSGCQKSESGSGEQGGGNVSSVEPPKFEAVAPTEQECQQFAEQLETAIAAGDSATASNMIDWDALLETSTAGIDVEDGFRKGFLDGAREQVAEAGITHQLCQVVAAGGSFRLLRVHSVGDEKRALFRMLLPEAGVNYQDFILNRESDGTVRAVDLYVFLSAECLSKTLRRMYLSTVAQQPSNLMQRLVSGDGDFVKHASEITDMSRLIREGNFQQAVNVYDGLPESMRTEKAILLGYIQAASQVDESLYLKAIDDFRAAHPDDPCIDMMSIDRHLLSKQFDEALASIDRLDESVQGDPYLNVLRADVALQQGDYAKAHELTSKSIEANPDLIGAYWTALAITLEEKDYAQTVSWLNKISETFMIEFEDLTSIPEYADFTDSPEYQAWMEANGASSP